MPIEIFESGIITTSLQKMRYITLRYFTEPARLVGQRAHVRTQAQRVRCTSASARIDEFSRPFRIIFFFSSCVCASFRIYLDLRWKDFRYIQHAQRTCTLHTRANMVFAQHSPCTKRMYGEIILCARRRHTAPMADAVLLHFLCVLMCIGKTGAERAHSILD